ncbi:PEP-utilizing enzyme [Ectobacillus funiculus]
MSGSVIQYEDLELQGAMKDHYIVVGYETSPKIIYHLNQVKGIVTEFGGMLCHAAIVAREFGIPCVVGVRGAMEVLQTGDVITVDGSQGLVFKGDEHGTLF